MAEQLLKVVTRRITRGQNSMWGTLHLDIQGGRLAGWLCDAWTEAGTPSADVLPPRLHWLSKEDDRFHLVRLDIPIAGGALITLGPVDTEIEPRREAFIRTTLAQWESEYLSSESVQISRTMREEDTYDFQVKRIRKLLADRAPGKEIRFGDRLQMISFRIIEPNTQTVLLERSGEWTPSILADKSDDELWGLIQNLSNHRL